MVESETLCNTLFYKTLSKQKKGCFGLRIKAVFIFVKSIFIARIFIKNGENCPIFYGVGHLLRSIFLWSDDVTDILAPILKLATFNVWSFYVSLARLKR